MRRHRYLDLAKTRLWHLTTASASNLERVLDWLSVRPRAETSHYYGANHNLEALIKTHLFVICPNQSGSTYLKRVLATSQNSWNLRREGQHTKGFAGPTPRGLGIGKLWGTGDWVEQLTDPTAHNWPQTRKAWYAQAYSHHPNATVFVEKSPPFLVNTAQLVAHFENCKFIFMVRNPYATVEGIRRRRRMNEPENLFSHKEELKQAAKHVMTCFDYQRQNIETYTDNSVFFTYEQMCDQATYVEGLIKSLVPELDDLIIKQHIRVKDYNEMLRNMNEQQISRLNCEELRWINEVFDDYPSLLDFFNYTRLA